MLIGRSFKNATGSRHQDKFDILTKSYFGSNIGSRSSIEDGMNKMERQKKTNPSRSYIAFASVTKRAHNFSGIVQLNLIESHNFISILVTLKL